MDHDEEIRLLQQAFPAFKCICELCDCGRHKHHKDCKRNAPKNRDRRQKPVTDYQATYRPVRDSRPRSNKRPPQTPRDPCPPDMNLHTIQRDDYKPYDVMKDGRPPAFIQNATYEPGDKPFFGVTQYQNTYTPKEPDNIVLHRAPDKRGRNPGHFDGRTTHKEYFKNWVPQTMKSYGELPSFTGSILFPDKTTRDDLRTVMRESFPGTHAEKRKPAKIPQGNLLLEGDHDMLTVHRDTYKKIDGDHRSEGVRFDPQPTVGRGNFFGETQQMRDFPPYKNGRRQPRPQRPCEPYPEMIDLKFNNRQSFETEQRNEFRGIDTNKHQPAKAIVPTDDYELPKEPFDNMTVHRADFVPKDLEIAAVRAKEPRTYVRKTDAKFDGQTTNKEHYKNWKPHLRTKHGDFNEAVRNMYIPPSKRVEGVTTMTASYTPKDGYRPDDFKPEPLPIDQQGEHDFRTVHKLTYKGQKPEMCKVDAYLLQQKLLREKKAEREACLAKQVAGRQILVKA